MTKFLVTGGAGFIGSHIAEYLVSLGHRVVVLDNLTTGKMENLEGIIDRIQFVQGDIRDRHELYDVVDGADYILHYAAEISTIKSVNTPHICNSVNVEGTLNLLTIARDCGVKKFIMASSSAVYGDTGTTPQREDFLPHPLSPYGASKICGEYYCEVFDKVYNLPTVRLRYFNVFGPRQSPDSEYAAVIPKFIDCALKNQDLHIYGNGEQTRDFVFVENVTQANYLACTSGNSSGNVYNIASGESINLLQLANLIIERTNSKSGIVFDPPKTGDIKYSVSSIERARDGLGFSPQVGFGEGLQKTIDYMSRF